GFQRRGEGVRPEALPQARSGTPRVRPDHRTRRPRFERVEGGSGDLPPPELGGSASPGVWARRRRSGPKAPDRRTRVRRVAGPVGRRASPKTPLDCLLSVGCPRPPDAARDVRRAVRMTPFECVPNFSEGRDATKVERIAGAARSAAGVTVLDVERNADHNRCVITLYGEGDPLLDAVVAMMRVATEVIDLTRHRGEHPRMGATDVVPFIPLGPSTMPEAVRLAERLGERVGKELEIPVYLYASAARRPERADLAKVREGQF